MVLSYKSLLMTTVMVFSGYSVAHAATDALITDAITLDHDGKPDAAYTMLNAHLTERVNDPDFNYALGLAALDSNHVAEAILAFQRVLAVKPDNAEARAEIARAYAQAGDIDTARAQFDTVLQDPSLPDPVRQRFTAMVKDYSKQIKGTGSDITGYIEANAGYDDNINTATTLTSVTLPIFAVFGPAALNGNARAIHDGYSEVQGGVSAVKGVGRQDRIFGSALGSYRANFSNADFNQGNITGTAGYSHSLANHDSVSISAQVQEFLLGQKSYRQAYGAIGQYSHVLEGGRALSVSAQFFRFNFDNQPLQDANRYAAALSYANRFFVASATVGREKTLQRAGDAQSNFFGDANISAEVPLSAKLSAVGGASVDVRRYEAADVIFLKERKDERLDATIGLKFHVGKSFSVRPTLTYTRNFSNIAINDYHRLTASVGVRLEF